VFYFCRVESPHRQIDPFRTPLDVGRAPFELSVASRVVLLGSCFAQNVGDRLRSCLPEGGVGQSAFGVLYNPASIAQALRLLLGEEEFSAEDSLFEGRDGLWHSRLHAAEFSAESREACAARVLEALERGRRELRRANVVCLTFGTNRVYRLREGGRVVANCHKEPAALFAEDSLSPADIAAEWEPLLRSLRTALPEAWVVFTVSPYIYLKYGLHGDALSKSALLLAVDALCRSCDRAAYFPAYEIVSRELRDYRFYDADMQHPSTQACDYVFARFQDWAFSDELRAFAADKIALTRAAAHRPLHPESDAARAFAADLQARREAFIEKWKSKTYKL